MFEVAGFRGSFVFPPGAQGVAADADTGLVVARAPDADGSEALLVAEGDRASVEIARINTALAGVEQAVAIRLDYQLPGQGAAFGWLYLPPDRPRERLPLVTIGYPGTVYGDTPPSPDGRGLGRNNYEVAALVGHGYAVLMPSMPTLSTASGHGFHYAGQLLPAVDAAIATGRIDPDRLGLWGHSFGGYMVATALTQTDRFKAAIAANGPYDLLAFIGSFTPWTRLDPGQGQSILPWAGWVETGQPQLRATAWADPQRYVANSPVYRADRIHTPLLIVGGERDTVSIQQSEELFSALYRQGKDAELLTYWGEDHAPLSPANVRDLFARAFAWFDGHFERRTATGRSSRGAEGGVDALLPAPRPTLDQ